MDKIEVIKAYYAACLAGNIPDIIRHVDPRCVVDEQSFLPYGKIEIIGPIQMMEVVAGTFFKVFETDTAMRDFQYFEADGRVVATAIWSMTGRYTGKRIDSFYVEYFEFREDQISLMRPFFHSVAEIEGAFDAARVAGVELNLTDPDK